MRIPRIFFGTWVARIYVGLAAALCVWVEYSIQTDPGANFAGVAPIFFTLPSSLVLLSLTPDNWVGSWVLYGVVMTCALINAALFNVLVAMTRRSAGDTKAGSIHMTRPGTGA